MRKRLVGGSDTSSICGNRVPPAAQRPGRTWRKAMSVYAYSSRRPRKGRPPSTPAAPIVQAPSGALINAILGYADIQLDMGGGKMMLRMSEDRLTDPVIRKALGREA